MTTFGHRYGVGSDWENDVAQRLVSRGWTVHPYGQSLFERTFIDTLRQLPRTRTALFLRFQPDLIGVRNDLCILIEAKSDEASVRPDCPDSFPYELASHDVACDLMKIGVPVVVVFKGWLAQYADKVEIALRFTDPEYLAKVRGSGTPFGLVRKYSLPTFDDFFDGLER